MNAKTDPAASGDSAANSHNAPQPVPPPTNPHFALFVATAGGLGYFPKAPGTLGSLVGLVLAVVPYWICFGLGAAIIAAHHGDYSIFLKASTWYSDLFLWAQIVLALFTAGLGVWALGMDGNDPAMLAALIGHAPVVKNLVAGPGATTPTTSSTNPNPSPSSLPTRLCSPGPIA